MGNNGAKTHFSHLFFADGNESSDEFGIEKGVVEVTAMSEA